MNETPNYGGRKRRKVPVSQGYRFSPLTFYPNGGLLYKPLLIAAALSALIFFVLAPAAVESSSAPSAPSSVSLNRADGTMTASWSSVSGATSYHVTYSSDGGASWSLAAFSHTGTSITIGVDNAKTYIVGVRAHGAGGWSGWTNSSSSGPYTPPKPDPTPTPKPVQPPSTPSSVSVTRADGTLTASWSAPARATSYHVTYSSDKGYNWSLAAFNHTGTSITISVDNSKTYIVGVRARNSGGDSGWVNSSSSGPYTPPTPTPTPAPSVTVTAARGTDATTATVSWTKYAGNDFDYYRFVVCPDANFIGGSCSNNVFTSDAYYDADTTGPVKVTGLEAQTGYGVILQVWRTGGAGALKPNTTIPAQTSSPTSTLSFGDATVSMQIYNVDTAIKTLTLPKATRSSDGASATVGTITYSLSPDLPAGLSFDATARTISGTPTETADYASYTYTATYGTNTATLSFTIEVLAAGEGAVGQANQAPQTIASTHNTHHRVSPSSDPPGSDNECYHNHGVSYPSGENSYFSDPDGDTLTIVSTSSHPGLVAITQNTPVRIRANHPADTWVTINTKATDPGGLSADFTWQYKMTCTTAMSVDENSAAGTDVASVGRKGNSNAAASQYTIEGDAANAFTINSSSGLIEVKSGASLDYETKTSYSGTVKYKATKTVDGTSHTNDSARSVTININNNTGPGKPNAPTVARDSTTPTTKLDVSWTAPSSTHPNGITDYDVQYRQTGASSWTSHSHSGTGTSTEISGLTAGKHYEVQVRATDGEGTGAWSDSGTAITQYTTQTRSIAENSAANTSIGAAVDADSNPKGFTLSYSLGGTDASSFDITSSSGQIKVKSGNVPDYETKKSYSVTVTMAVSGTTSVTGTGNTGLSPNGTGDYLIPVTINITDVQETPQFPKDTDTRSIAENSAVGTNIGAAVTASSGQAALTYTLDGTDKDKFSIVSTSGQIQVKAGNIPDYEAKTSYTVEVDVTDGKDSSNNNDSSIDDTITITINVTDVNEPPPKMGAPTVAANSTTPTTKIDVSWTAPTTAQMSGKPAVNDYDVQYRLSGNTGWTDASFTGTGTSTALTGLTSGKTYEVQVRAVNDEGDGAWSDSSSTITQAGSVTRSIAENSAAGSNVGAAVTTTANTNGYDLTHALSGTDASKFSIDSSTGQITVGTGTTLDYETKTSYSVTVTVTAAQSGAQGQSFTLDPNAPGDYTIPVTINVTDVDETPAFDDGASTTRSIAENSAVGTNVGAAVTATDAENETLTYSLTGTDASKFDIGSSTGQITVKTGNIPNYEAKTSYSVTANVTDKNDESGNSDTVIDDTISVTINVTDVDEPPGAPTLTVSNHSTTPTTKISLSWTAPTMTGKPALSGYDVQYQLAGANNWTDKTHSGTGTTATLTGLTTGKTYNVRVRAKNDEGESGWATGSAITQAGSVTRSIAENSVAGTDIGSPVTATSNTNGYTLTHSLSGTDASSFTIVSSSGQIEVKSALDYETKTSYSVTVTVNAAQSGANAQSFTLDPNAPGNYVIPVTINVTNVNEGPEFADDTATRSIDENSAAGTNIGAAVTAGADPEGDTRTYSLTGTDAAKFDIGSSTGQITVKTGNVPDYEAKTSYSVTVNVTDKKAADGTANTAIDDTISVTINVTDVNEPPDAPAAPTVWQNTATPKTKLDVSWTAPDMTGKPAISDYDVQYKKSADSTWTSHSFTGTGTTTTLTGLDEGTEYDVQVMAKNDEGDSAWSTSGSANTQDKNVHSEFPDDTATRSIAENSAAGTNVGAAITATDTEGHTMYYSLSGTDGSKFDVGLNTGQVTVKAGNIPNYEAKTSYSVTVEVSDRKDSDDNADTKIDDTIAVTINVTDVAEPPAAPTLSVSPNSTSPTSKIDVSWTAPDMTGKPAISGYDVQYKLANDNDWTAKTHSGTGTSTALTGLSTGKTYDVQVRAKNDEGNSPWASGSTVTDANAVSRSIPENSAAGTDIGNPVTAKANSNYTYSHALGGTDASDFDIESSSGQIQVKSALDYETKTSYSVIVTVTAAAAQVQAQSLDPNAPGNYKVPVTINVTDVNEKSEFNDGTATSRSVAENSAAGTNVGAPVKATDPDAGDTLTYSLTGTDASKFEIGSGTAQITVKSGTTLDYEAKSSYSVTVNVTDGKKADGTADTTIDDTIAVTINVTDVSEAPAKPAAPSVVQNSATPKTKLDVSWTAPDMTGKPPITDYDVQYKKSSDSTWSSHSFTGKSTRTTIESLTEGTEYDVQVRATNDEGTSGWSDSGSAKTQDKNVNPAFSLSSATRNIAENSAVNTKVGAPVTATDTENNTLYYGLTGTDADKFNIGLNDGQITVGSGTDLDYEAKTSYSVTVTVSDRKDSDDVADTVIDDTAAVTINVTDVNEPLGKPGIPTQKSNTTTSITVTWTAPDATGKPPVKEYWIRYWKKGTDYLTAWTVTTNEALMDTAPTANHPSAPLQPGTAYEVEVMAENDEGYGAWSSLATVYTRSLGSIAPRVPNNPPPATPTPTPIPTATPTPVPTATPTPVPTATPTPTPTPVPTATPTPVPTATPTPVPTATPTPLIIAAAGAPPTATPTPTAVPTATPRPTATPTPTAIPTATPTPRPTATPTPVPTATPTPTAIPTATPTPTAIPTATPTPTAIPTATPTPTAIPTATPTPTAIPTATPTPFIMAASVPPTATPTPTAIPTATPTPTAIPTATPTPTAIPTATATPWPTVTPTPTDDTQTRIRSQAARRSLSVPTATHTPTPEPTHTATPMPASTFTPTPTAVPIPVVVSGLTPEAPDDGCDCFWLGVLGGVLLGALTLLIAYVVKRRRELQNGVRPQGQIETNDLNQ